MLGRHNCRSWRPRNDTPHEGNHLPGKCRRCWQLCSRPAQDSGIRCETCEYDLAQHPDSRVRLALVMEGTVSASTLSLMTNDADASVADLAKTFTYRLEHSIKRPLKNGVSTARNPFLGAKAVTAKAAGAAAPGPDSWLSEMAQAQSPQPTEIPRREQAVRHG